MARESFTNDTPYSPSAFGGIKATIDRRSDQDPTKTIAGNASGETLEVDRYRDMGEAMSRRDPYRFDWSQAAQSHSQAAQAGAAQGDAANAWRDQANGSDRTAFNYGQSLLDRGAENQRAAAVSTAGGPLAQMGAMGRAANAESAFRQKGTQELEAQRADDMATGRAGWANALGQQRKMDATGQGLSDQQTELGANAAAQQAKLNDAGQYDMEKLGVDAEQQALAGRQHLQATNDKKRADIAAAGDADRARTMATFNTATSTLGNTVAPGFGTAFTTGMEAARSADGQDPPSDERSKDKQPMNALLDIIQTPAKLSGDGEWRDIARERALKDAREDMENDTRAANTGVTGAPKGYAESRRGKAGDMFGGGPSGHGAWASSWDEDHGMAPGTRDVLKYGTPTAASEERMDDFSKAVMTSDERAKNKAPAPAAAETPEEKKAREDKEDAEKTAAFMADTPKDGPAYKRPSSYEEMSKAIDAKHEEERQAKENQKKRNEAQAAEFMAREDAELIRRNNERKWTPGFITRWANRGIEERARARTPERNIELAVAHDKDNAESEARRHKHDADVPAWGRSLITGAAGTRQPISFVRESGDPWRPEGNLSAGEITSDERTKIVPLRYEGESGIEQHYDQDVAKSKEDFSNGGASLSGPTPRYSKAREAPSAARPAPGKPKARRPTDDELRRQADEMLDTQRAKDGAQLGEGPSVRDSHDPPKWLEDHMSDERSKTKSGNPLIEMQKGANRALRGETYTYKEGFGEDPHQVHHGFMAQNLEKNPITATAVREDESGLKKVNNEDALRVTAAGVASLQEQQDELDKAIDALAARRGKKKVA